MPSLPHPVDPQAEPASFKYPQRFSPHYCAWPTQVALATLFAVTPGWYRSDQLAEALAAELPVTESWLFEVFRWANRDGVIKRRKWGAWRLVHIDPDRMARAWPRFDPSQFHVVPIQVEPIDPGPRAG